jgi:hypothetical protein
MGGHGPDRLDQSALDVVEQSMEMLRLGNNVC